MDDLEMREKIGYIVGTLEKVDSKVEKLDVRLEKIEEKHTAAYAVYKFARYCGVGLLALLTFNFGDLAKLFLKLGG